MKTMINECELKYDYLLELQLQPFCNTSYIEKEAISIIEMYLDAIEQELYIKSTGDIYDRLNRVLVTITYKKGTITQGIDFSKIKKESIDDRINKLRQIIQRFSDYYARYTYIGKVLVSNFENIDYSVFYLNTAFCSYSNKGDLLGGIYIADSSNVWKDLVKLITHIETKEDRKNIVNDILHYRIPAHDLESIFCSWDYDCRLDVDTVRVYTQAGKEVCAITTVGDSYKDLMNAKTLLPKQQMNALLVNYFKLTSMKN